MIKVKLFESDLHRNETTFRPYWFIKDQLKNVGIELTTDADTYDFLLVGQASIADKKKSMKESVDMGVEKLKSIDGDYIILDGQDAPTLIGTVDVFRHVYKDKNCKLFLKTSYYKDFDLYKKGWNLGRMYWGPGEYSVPDIDEMKPKMKLAGMNWLSTIQPQWQSFDSTSKVNDVWAFFQYPMHKKVFEHGTLQSFHYDEFRKGLHDKLDNLEKKYKIIRMTDGMRVPHNEYYQQMYASKIVIAAFGYGEMAPRDIETAMFGNVLLKNDMSHLWTIPNPYIPNETYVPVKWDWSDVEEKIEQTLSQFEKLQRVFAMTLRNKYMVENSSLQRVIHVYNLFKDLDGVEHE